MKTVTTFKLYRAALALLFFTTSLAVAAPQVLDKVAVIVDDDVVMESELTERIQQIEVQLKSQDRPMPPAAEVREQVLNQMIVESLQMQMAQRAGVRISDAQLNQAMSRVAGQNNLDLDQFRAMLEQQGLSYTATREQIRKEMIIQQVQSGNINNRVEVTDQEITNFLASSEGKQQSAAQYRIAHILLPMDSVGMAADEGRQTALLERAKRDINAGTDLVKWLDQYRKEGGTALQGGDLGWRKADDLPAVFAEIVPDTEPGQAAGPIRSAGGLHLVQVVERRGGPQIIDQTHARHILIKPSEIRTDEQSEQLLVDIRKRVIGGEDFADLARQYSEDFGSAQEGGDLGWARKGQFVPIFEETMASLQIDQISQPIRSQFGWHILQVLERRKYDVSQEAARDQAYRYLFQRKFQDELDSWLQKIRDEAYVDIKA
jgi:peptidyl-prolyl cis-trans isomerase SurA